MGRFPRRLIAGALIALSCAPGAGAERLAIGMRQAPTDLHPLFDAQLAKRFLFGLSLRGPTAYGVDWALQPMIAETVPSFENGLARPWAAPGGAAGVAIDFMIREDATWADGRPVTAADFALSWEIGRHPDSGVPNFEFYQRLKAVEIVGPKHARLFFDRVTYRYNALGDFTPTPDHLERPLFEADPARYRAESLYRRAPETPGLWNGPYRLISAEAGALYAFAPNPHWGGEPPFFQSVEVRVVENTAALEANLLSGAVDMLAGEVGLGADQVAALEARAGARFAYHYEPSLFYEHLTPNLAHPALADARVRRALALAIDREAIAEQVFAGRATPAAGFMAPLDPMAADLPPIAHDPEQARALLDEAGWRMGAGGVRRDADGAPLELALVTTSGDRTRALVQQIIQSWWAGIGVRAKPDAEPPRLLFGETLRMRRFDGLALFAWISAPEHLPKTTLRSDQIPEAANGFGGQNYGGFVNADADRLIDAIEITRDPAARRPLWAELQRLYRAQLPDIPLYFRQYAFVTPPWLAGLEPRGHMDLSTFGIERWRRAD